METVSEKNFIKDVCRRGGLSSGWSRFLVVARLAGLSTMLPLFQCLTLHLIQKELSIVVMSHLLPDSGRAIDETKVITAGSPAKSVQSEDVVIAVDENLPLIHKDTIITISSQVSQVRGSLNTSATSSFLPRPCSSFVALVPRWGAVDCTPAFNLMCCCCGCCCLFVVVVCFLGECCLIQVVWGVAGVVLWYTREWGWGV